MCSWSVRHCTQNSRNRGAGIFLFGLRAGQCYSFHIYLLNNYHEQLPFYTGVQCARQMKFLPSWSLYSDILSQTEMYTIKINMTGLICCLNFPRKTDKISLAADWSLQKPDVATERISQRACHLVPAVLTQAWQAAMNCVCQLVARHQCRLKQLAESLTQWLDSLWVSQDYHCCPDQKPLWSWAKMPRRELKISSWRIQARPSYPGTRRGMQGRWKTNVSKKTEVNQTFPLTPHTLPCKS